MARTHQPRDEIAHQCGQLLHNSLLAFDTLTVLFDDCQADGLGPNVSQVLVSPPR